MSRNSKLDRRNFLKNAAAGAASVALLSKNAHAEISETALTLPPSPSKRRIIPLNDGWLFSEKVETGSTDPKHKDSGYARVTIPHTNKLLPIGGFDEKEYCFVSIYRRHFTLPSDLKDHRIFIDFGGVMTAARVFINGRDLGEYRGGYTPFSFELTKDIKWKGDNVIAVVVDSTERSDIPPFGGLIDYLTFGGIYRDVAIRAVPKIYVDNVFAKPVNVLSNNRSVAVKCFIAGEASSPLQMTTELFDDGKLMASASGNVSGTGEQNLTLTDLRSVVLWDLDRPKLYSVRVSLKNGNDVVDHYETRIGFREAKFTTEGFFLNGRVVKLRGLNRHQTYPFVGQAMPWRGQKHDAWILKKELKCNIVRTSHYPQSPHFLDACDDLGLLVFEEIPGWQHIGDKNWQDLTVQHVGEMIKRDWNHPSIILWGVRVNESGDNEEFYTRTNKLARELDDSRQTGGVRFRYNSQRLEDVYTMNDFGFPLRPPNHPLYLNTEFSGHMYPTKRADNLERIREHMHRHARVHDQIASDA